MGAVKFADPEMGLYGYANGGASHDEGRSHGGPEKHDLQRGPCPFLQLYSPESPPRNK